MDAVDKLFNPLQEYVKGHAWESTFQELFEAEKDNVDLRTDLSIQEIVIINKLIIDNEFLNEKIKLEKIPLNLFGSFINHYLRLKISKDRLSRAEFVDINRRERFDKDMQKIGNFANIAKVKQ